MTLAGLPLAIAEQKLNEQNRIYRVEYLPNLWQNKGVWHVIRESHNEAAVVITVTLFAQLKEKDALR